MIPPMSKEEAENLCKKNDETLFIDSDTGYICCKECRNPIFFVAIWGSISVLNMYDGNFDYVDWLEKYDNIEDMAGTILCPDCNVEFEVVDDDGHYIIMPDDVVSEIIRYNHYVEENK